MTRLDVAAIALHPELSRSRIGKLIRDGHVRVGGEVVTKPAARVAEGTSIEIDVPPPVPLELQPQDLPLRIVFEDEHLVVVDKAPGMVVHPGAGNPEGTLVHALLHRVGDLSGIGGVLRPGIVHRLDKGTSGLMVVAKNDTAHRELARQFAAHTAGRRYLALCLGAPQQMRGTIRSHLARHPRDRVRFASTTRGGKLAITHWERVESWGDASLVRCRLETGRTHQVRVHLFEAGWPILGDPLYGRRRKVPERFDAVVVPERPFLHAEALTLVHPVRGEPMHWEADVPGDFQAALEAARS